MSPSIIDYEIVGDFFYYIGRENRGNKKDGSVCILLKNVFSFNNIRIQEIKSDIISVDLFATTLGYRPPNNRSIDADQLRKTLADLTALPWKLMFSEYIPEIDWIKSTSSSLNLQSSSHSLIVWICVKKHIIPFENIVFLTLFFHQMIQFQTLK